MGERVAITVNILLKREENYWLAHCLELDIVATADSMEQVRKEINDLVLAQVQYAFETGNLENLYHPAPMEVWKEWQACRVQIENEYPIETSPSGETDSDLERLVAPWVITKTCRLSESHYA